MQRLLILLFVGCFFGTVQVQAHSPYVGGGLWLEVPYNSLGSSGFSLQGGATVIGGLELRASADIFWLFTWSGLVSAEVLYNLAASDELDVYLGAGPSLGYTITSFSPLPGEPAYAYRLDLAATAGLEYLFGRVGVFADFKVPVLSALEYRALFGVLRTGVNVYF